MSEAKRREYEMTIEYVKKLLRQLRSRIDPLEIIDYMKERNLPLPDFDDIEEIEHEFSAEFNEKMAQLFKEVYREEYAYPHPVD